VLDELRARQRREGKTLGRLPSELLATALRVSLTDTDTVRRHAGAIT
jgi:hypothetical protein